MVDGEDGDNNDGCNWEVRFKYIQELSFYSVPWQHKITIAV